MAEVHEKEKKLTSDVARTVEQELPDVEVLAVELLSPARFCVYIDHPSGVDHALCERVTGLLRSYLDHYTVDVSSPGSGRPLRKPAHFRGALGRKVSLRTDVEVGGRTRFRGELVAAGEHTLTVAAGAGSVDIPYDAIVRGNLFDEGALR
jgi:ribosome maturation factor RimP